jgi:predicted O-linked N-acetylglucosamine transferase (SPINDLY family)
MNGPVPIQQAFATAVQQHQAGRVREAEAVYRQIVAAQPSHADALHMLGIALHQLGRGSEGIAVLRQAVAIKPNAADFRANLGSVLAAVGQNQAAAAEFRAAIALKADLAEAHHSLAKLLASSGEMDEAIAEFRKAVSIKPALAEAHSNLGDALKATGELDEALASYRRAMTLSPDVRWASNLVYSLYLHPDSTPRKIFEAHQRWAQSHAESLASQIPIHRNEPTPGKRLRIGYVGANFRDHPQPGFLLPLLANRDRSAFEVLCYSNVSEPDAITQRLRGLADGWRDIASMTDQQAAEQITRDAIDILIDLDMHGPQNRLLVFARKPAPVQVSGLAYPGTTGMLAVDYHFADSHLDADGTDAGFYTEQSMRVGGSMFCYEPLHGDHSVVELPARRNGFITFGYVGDFARATSRAIELWSSALAAVDRSHLLIVAPRGSARERVLAIMSQSGIGRDRIEFVDPPLRAAMADLYQRIDVCLDSFPCNGRTGTLDALWMGVPVITINGRTGVSRVGSRLLSALGLAEMVADTPEQLPEIVRRIAGDLEALSGIRSSLRDRLKSSALMEGQRAARSFEAAYRQMWTGWCEGQRRTSSIVTLS